MSYKYKVGIIGLGFVGKGVEDLLKDYVTQRYDPNAETLEDKNEDFNRFRDLDLVVIAVPTPTAADGISCNTEIVQNSISRLNSVNFRGVVLIKSTLPPSDLLYLKESCSLRIVFSPEYMGESKYFIPPWKYPDSREMKTHTWQIFGGKREDTEVCVEIFKTRMSIETHFYQTDLATASLTKYLENCFYALKVTFVNEWYDIAKAYGVDWNELRELWLADPRMNRNHTLVFKKDRGYGGKCFPKDIKALIADARKHGYNPEIMETVDRVNEKIRKNNV